MFTVKFDNKTSEIIWKSKVHA